MSPGTSGILERLLARFRTPAFREQAGVLVWLSVHYFVVKACVNVAYITNQTAFLKREGVQYLPVVYVAMNVLYITLQSWVVRSSSRDPRARLMQIPLLFVTAALLQGVLFGVGDVPAVITATPLLLVMVYDLLFNQFFLQEVGQVLDLKSAKRGLPVILAAGSLSFISSGLVLRVALTMGDLPVVILVTSLGFLLVWPIPLRLGRMARAAAAATPPTAGGEAAAGGESRRLPALARWLVVSQFLLILAKYWLDFHYSSAATRLRASEESLAGFFAVFTSGTDSAILISQTMVVPWLLRRGSLPVLFMLTPMILAVVCFFAAGTGSLEAVLVAQFLFTLLVRSIHGSVWPLLLQPLDDAARHRAFGLIGIASALGSLTASLTLLAVASSLEPSTALMFTAVLFGAMTFVGARLRQPYRRQIRSAILAAAGAGDEGARADVREADDFDPLRPTLHRPMQAGTVAVDPVRMDRAVISVIRDAESLRLVGKTTRWVLESGGPGTADLLRRLLTDASIGPRQRAAVLEELVEATGRLGLVPEVRALAGDPSPRVAMMAASALLIGSGEPSDLDHALKAIWASRHDPDPARRAAGVFALGFLARRGFPDFLDCLAEALTDPDPMVEEGALEALAASASPRVPEILEDHRARHATCPVAPRIAEALERSRTLVQQEIGSLLDSMTKDERSRLERLLRGMPRERRPWLAACLRLEEREIRHAMWTWLECLPAGQDPATLLGSQPEALAEPGSISRLIEGHGGLPLPALGPLFDDLTHQGARAWLGALTRSALVRCLKEHAASEVLERAGGAPVPGAADRLAGNRGFVLEQAARLTPDPAGCHDALRGLASPDRHVRALSAEYVEQALPREVHPLLLALLEERAAGEAWVDRLRSLPAVGALPANEAEAAHLLGLQRGLELRP